MNNSFGKPVGARSRLLITLLSGLAVIVLALGVAACGDDDDDTSDGATATSKPATSSFDYESLSGEISVDGSSTVFPITQAVAEEFSSEAPDVRVNVAFSGTGGGFEKFCRGEIEVSDASRPIKDSETEACAGNGIEDVLELQVAVDALTVMVHPDNDFVECLTVQQVHDIFRTGGVTSWNQVDPSFPDEKISFYYPGTDSGTFDYFVEAIIEGVDENATHRGDGTSSEDDNILAQGIENDTNSIGYFGFAYFQEAGSALKAVSIDDGAGCVEPSYDTALSGEYTPLSRPLFIYTRTSFFEDPQSPVLGFVNFYLESAEALVPEVGYITVSEDILQEQISKIEPFLP